MNRPAIKGTPSAGLWAVALALGATSCTADTAGLDGNEAPLDGGDGGDPSDSGDAADAGALLWESSLYCEARGGVRVPVGMRFANGSNDCFCQPNNCVGDRCEAFCTAAVFDGGVPVCASSSGCGRGNCNYFPGCAAPEGSCSMVQSSCQATTPQPWDPADGLPPMLFCGCDGVTYASDCPGVPYAHTGPCP